MPINIICLGKTRETWIKTGIEEYQKRLYPPWTVTWTELKDISIKETGLIETVKNKEAIILNKAISPTSYLIALDEHGKGYDSISFAKLMNDVLMSKEVEFLVGGVYGLDKTVLSKADLMLSFSSFTFPHQLIRLILIEQIYRAWAINKGKNYHY